MTLVGGLGWAPSLFASAEGVAGVVAESGGRKAGWELLDRYCGSAVVAGWEEEAPTSFGRIGEYEVVDAGSDG